jgi:hypothetical protein
MWLVVTDSGIEVAVGRVLNITPTPDGVVIVQNEWDARLRTWMIPSIATLRWLIYEATAGENAAENLPPTITQLNSPREGEVEWFHIWRRYGVRISKSHIYYWVRGVHSPYNGRLIPSLELLKPSEELAYVIGVKVGDGYAYRRRRTIKGYNDVKIGLKARDGSLSRSSLGVLQRFWAGNK